MYVPKISKVLLIIKQTESFAGFLHLAVGERNIPLSYFIRKSDTVHGVAPPMVRDNAYSEERGYVDEDLITGSSHTHPCFKIDNSKLRY